jgi:hypothetical protein
MVKVCNDEYYSILSHRAQNLSTANNHHPTKLPTNTAYYTDMTWKYLLKLLMKNKKILEYKSTIDINIEWGNSYPRDPSPVAGVFSTQTLF